MALSRKLRLLSLINAAIAPVFFIGSAATIAAGHLNFILEITSIAYMRAFVTRGLNFLDIRNGYAAKDFRKTLSTPPFEFNHPHIRTTDFAKRVGRILDELQKDDEGRKLVDNAARKNIGVIEVGSGDALNGTDESSDLFGSYDAKNRIIKIYDTHNRGDEIINTLIHELTHAVQPTPVAVHSYKTQREFTLLREGDAFSMPVYLAWKLKKSGHPELWECMSRTPHSDAGFSETEKFEMAARSSADLDEARRKFIRDWYMGINKYSYLEKIKETRKLTEIGKPRRSFDEMEADFLDIGWMENCGGETLKWLALLPGKIFYQLFGEMPAQLFNAAAGITTKRHVGMLEKFWGRPYLRSDGFDIQDLAGVEIPVQQAMERASKESSIRHPEMLDQNLKASATPLLFIGDILSQHIIGRSTPLDIDAAVRSAIDELNTYMARKPETIEELWAMVDTMPVPQNLVSKHLFRRSFKVSPSTPE